LNVAWSPAVLVASDYQYYAVGNTNDVKTETRGLIVMQGGDFGGQPDLRACLGQSSMDGNRSLNFLTAAGSQEYEAYWGMPMRKPWPA
jgi:hypothetical protein